MKNEEKSAYISDLELQPEIMKLQGELKIAYSEIERLRDKLVLSEESTATQSTNTTKQGQSEKQVPIS